MPIELRITGADTKEFFANAAHAFLLLAHGGNTVFAQPPAANPNAPVSADAPGAASVSAETVGPVAEPVGDVTKTVVEKAPRKNAKKDKAPVVIDAEPAKVETPDEDPLGLNDVAKPAVAKQTYTLDDMRQRVKDIIENGTKRGATMPENVAYVRRLFEPFKIKLAAELKEGQFADFIAASAPYLDGTAK